VSVFGGRAWLAAAYGADYLTFLPVSSSVYALRFATVVLRLVVPPLAGSHFFVLHLGARTRSAPRLPGKPSRQLSLCHHACHKDGWANVFVAGWVAFMSLLPSSRALAAVCRGHSASAAGNHTLCSSVQPTPADAILPSFCHTCGSDALFLLQTRWYDVGRPASVAATRKNCTAAFDRVWASPAYLPLRHYYCHVSALFTLASSCLAWHLHAADAIAYLLGCGLGERTMLHCFSRDGLDDIAVQYYTLQLASSRGACLPPLLLTFIVPNINGYLCRGCCAGSVSSRLRGLDISCGYIFGGAAPFLLPDLVMPAFAPLFGRCTVWRPAAFCGRVPSRVCSFLVVPLVNLCRYSYAACGPSSVILYLNSEQAGRVCGRAGHAGRVCGLCCRMAHFDASPASHH